MEAVAWQENVNLGHIGGDKTPIGIWQSRNLEFVNPAKVSLDRRFFDPADRTFDSFFFPDLQICDCIEFVQLQIGVVSQVRG